MTDLLPRGTWGINVEIDPDDGAHRRRAAVLEEIGHDALWVAGGQVDRLDRFDELIAATDRVRVASGILALGVHPTDAISDLHHRLASSGRLVVGLGGPQEARPMTALAGHLDELDRLRVGPDQRLLAALGPRKTDVARERSAGAVTLLTTPRATSATRERVGPARLVVVHQMVALTLDPAEARAAARVPLGFLQGVAGYRANWRREGFVDDEIDGLADRLVDSLVAWGDADAIARRLVEHRAAGADHVAVSLLPVPGADPVRAAEKILAAARTHH